MTGAGAPALAFVLTLALSACAATSPSWLTGDGWLAARCAASAALLIRAGDISPALQVQHAAWEETTDAFSPSTDGRLEMESRASQWLGWGMNREAHAHQFLQAECDDGALARVRETL